LSLDGSFRPGGVTLLASLLINIEDLFDQGYLFVIVNCSAKHNLLGHYGTGTVIGRYAMKTCRPIL